MSLVITSLTYFILFSVQIYVYIITVSNKNKSNFLKIMLSLSVCLFSMKAAIALCRNRDISS